MPRQPNPQNRLACDRCHGQKLRCPRQEGQGACQRCLRANATCIFSPRQKRTSPSSINKEKESQAQHDSHSALQDTTMDLGMLDPMFNLKFPSQTDLIDTNMTPDLPPQFLNADSIDMSVMDCPWSAALGFGSPNATPWDVDVPLQSSAPQPGQNLAGLPNIKYHHSSDSSSNTASTAANTPSSTTTAENNTDCDATSSTDMTLAGSVHELANLNVRLFNQFKVLPPLCDQDQIPEDSFVSPDSDSPLIAIDDIFRTTQSLIDIMVRFYPSAGKEAKLIPDTGILLMLLSCTDRVFDIFELLFGHMRGCLVTKVMPLTADGRVFSLPELRIGSYKPPAPTAVTVHMLIIIMMASHLFDQLQEVLGVGRSNAANNTDSVVLANPNHCEVELAVGSRSHFPNFTEEARAAVTRRARSVAIQIVDARKMVLNLPGMNGSGSLNPFMATAKG